MLYDVIVVGSGISGLYAALYAKRCGQNVAVLTKNNPFRSNSAVASGGINAVINLSEYDSFEQHVDDTIKGSDGLVYKRNIQEMCRTAPEIVRELSEIGVGFDTDDSGDISQRPFGGTRAKRTCYIADKTGAAIVQKLLLQCREEGVKILSNYFFMNMNFYQGKLSGVTVLRRRDSNVMPLACKALILAGGGYAGIYRGHTTNSQDSSGDTVAAALRAGMRLSNMEFVQFHPTTLKHKAVLISEAGRGEGAIIVDEEGREFVEPLLTRDKLSRAILKHEAQGHEAFLDFRHLDEKLIDKKLPSTKKTALLAAGINITKELVPIEPAAHYSIGGIWSRPDTSTDIPGVFACGESALTGVHGANRLGGNSLLEGAFFGRKAGIEASQVAKRSSFMPIDYSYIEKETRIVDMIMEGENVYNSTAMRKSLGEVMFKHVGVFRDEKGLLSALDYIHYLLRKSYGLHCVNKEKENNVELLSILEFNNALLMAESIVMSALKRKESRGVHYRTDFTKRDDKHFNASSFISMINSGLFKVRFESPAKKSFFYKLKKLLK